MRLPGRIVQLVCLRGSSKLPTKLREREVRLDVRLKQEDAGFIAIDMPEFFSVLTSHARRHIW